MNEPHLNLLWADDDNEGMLNPLSWAIEKAGFQLVKATNYTDARKLLEAGHIHSLLVDIILPHASGTGTLGSNLGIELAEFAAQNGVRAVSFLTVVLQSEVSKGYKGLKRTHNKVKFNYFDKLLLLEPNTINALMQSLQPDDH